MLYRALAGDGDYPAVVRASIAHRCDIAIDYPGISLSLTVPFSKEPREMVPRGSCFFAPDDR